VRPKINSEDAPESGVIGDGKTLDASKQYGSSTITSYLGKENGLDNSNISAGQQRPMTKGSNNYSEQL